jgi:hypothetical protein
MTRKRFLKAKEDDASKVRTAKRMKFADTAKNIVYFANSSIEPDLRESDEKVF